MTFSDLHLYLFECLDQQAKAMRYLRMSLDECAAIPDDAPMTPHELTLYESLASRFGRASDMLVNKLFRALDAFELYEGGSPLDVINRAEKRGLLDDAGALREIRRVRNRIAHEYNIEDFPKFMGDIRRLCGALFDIFERTKAYIDKLASA